MRRPPHKSVVSLSLAGFVGESFDQQPTHRHEGDDKKSRNCFHDPY